VSGLVAAREGRMLPRDFFRQLAAEADLDAVLRRLGETVFQDRLADAAAVRRLDEIAEQALADCARELRALSPSDVATCHLDVRRTLAELRRFVRHKEAHPDEERPSEPSDEDDVWERLWADLPADAPHYARRAVERARDLLPAASERPELLDVAVDSQCLRALCEEAERRGNASIAGYWRRYDTAKGAEAFWRARTLRLDQEVQDVLVGERQEAALFAELARTDEADWPDLLSGAVDGLAPGRLRDLQGAARIGEFARQAAEALADYARRARSVAFGPERVFGYAIGMEAEVFNLKLMVGGRAAGVAPELLEERLRPCYV